MPTDSLPQFFLSVIFILGGLAILAGVLAVGGYVFFLWFKYRGREAVALDSTLLQISVPRENEIKIDAAEQLFASLAALRKTRKIDFFKPQPHISFEIVGMPGDIRFYVYVNNKIRDFVEKQINGAYPDAEIVQVTELSAKLKKDAIMGDEYNIFAEDGKVAFLSFRLKGAPYVPLKVFKDLPTDPLSSLTSILAKMGEGEGAVLQLVIRPADGKWKKAGKSFIAGTKKKEANPETAKYSTDSKEIEGIENKLAHPGFDVAVRIVVSAKTKESAEAHLANIATGLGQYAGANYLKKNKQKLKNLFITDFIYRYMPLWRQTALLSSEELATIFHLPNKSVTTPGIHWLTSKKAPAPATLPTEGLYLGQSTFRGTSRPVYVSLEDRQRHTYIIGQTGTGKSQLLLRMIMQDIQNGEGVAVVDPHGDLIEDILHLMPPQRAEDVILFDPSDDTRPMGINLLEADTEQQKHFVTTSIIGLMYKLFDPNQTGIVGPRFEHTVRNAMLTVMSDKGATFIEVMRALTDMSYVQEILPRVTDPIVRRFWTDQIAQTSDFHKSETLDYITSKFGRFVTNKMIRNIIGQSESSFNFREVMDNRKILLINLAKGKIGEENSNFLGLVLVPKILVAAMSRQDMPMEQRKNFFLYVDEFQNFATPDFAQILSEARKYRLNLIVANQFIGQMTEEIKNAIFGNVGTKLAFRIGVTDANYMQHEYQPTFAEGDMLNIDRFNAYIKTVVNNEPMPSFSIDTTPDFEALNKARNPKVAELIKELSRLKYGRDVTQVEAEISHRAKL